jgi:hypothetical protein
MKNLLMIEWVFTLKSEFNKVHPPQGLSKARQVNMFFDSL